MDAIWDETHSSRVTMCQCMHCSGEFVVTFSDPVASDPVSAGVDDSYGNTQGAGDVCSYDVDDEFLD